MDRWLASLGAEGRWESQGTFSLDQRQALSKLRHFQLANPFHYVLRLVRCAVLCGASQVQIRSSLSGTRVTFDQTAMDWQQLPRWLDILLAGQGGPGSELAVALNTALRSRVVRVAVSLSDGARGATLLLGEESAFQESSGLPRGTVFWVERRRASSWLHRLADRWQAYSPETEVVRRRCGYTPIPVLVNGVQINPARFGGTCNQPAHHVLELRWVDPEGACIGLSAPSQASRLFYAPRQDSYVRPVVSAGLELCAGAAGLRRSPSDSVVTWVQAGVALMQTAVPHGPPGFKVVLPCEGLRLNAAGESLVFDEHFQERLDWLRNWLGRVCQWLNKCFGEGSMAQQLERAVQARGGLGREEWLFRL